MAEPEQDWHDRKNWTDRETREWFQVYPDRFGADAFPGMRDALAWVNKVYELGATSVKVRQGTYPMLLIFSGTMVRITRTWSRPPYQGYGVPR